MAARSAVDVLMERVPRGLSARVIGMSALGGARAYNPVVAVYGPDGNELAQIPTGTSNSGESFHLNWTYIREWDPRFVAGSVLHMLANRNVVNMAARTSDRTRLAAIKEFRSGRAVPPEVQAVVDAVRECYESTRGEDTQRRKSEIKAIVRRLRGKLDEEELVQIWREVAVEEVLKS